VCHSARLLSVQIAEWFADFGPQQERTTAGGPLASEGRSWSRLSSSEKPRSSAGPRLPAAFWGLLVLSVAVRLIGITRPLLGNFATKNVVYAMIARNWAEGRAPLWYPTLDCLAAGRRSLHMVDFPVAAYLAGWLWRTLGGSLDVWGRASAVAFSTASVVLMYLFVRRRHGQTAAIGAGFVLALSPVSIIYGQSFMLEASLVFFTLGTFYCLDRYLEAGRFAWLATTTVCLALLLLTKVYMLVLLLPLGVMVFCRGRRVGPRRADRPSARGNHGREPTQRPLLQAEPPLAQPVFPTRPVHAPAALAAVLAIVPTALWCAHAIHTAAPGGPLAEQVYYSLRESAGKHSPPHPLLWSADFYRQVYDDLAGVVLTPVALMLAAVGLVDRAWRQHIAWLLAVFVLVLALPLKFYELNYYYLAVLPPLCVLAGLGWRVIERRLQPARPAVTALLLIALVVSLRYAAGPAFVTPAEDRAVPAAAAAIRDRTGEDEPVATMHGSTIDLLYYCNRSGWSIPPHEAELESVLADCRRRGARYLVTAGVAAEGRQPEIPAALRGWPVALRGEGFCIYRLVEGDSVSRPSQRGVFSAPRPQVGAGTAP